MLRKHSAATVVVVPIAAMINSDWLFKSYLGFFCFSCEKKLMQTCTPVNYRNSLAILVSYDGCNSFIL